MDVPNAIINDAIKKKAGYKYYMAKKVETNVPNKLKKDVVPRKTRSLTIAEEAVAVEDPAVQSLLDLRKGSKASKLESLRQKKQPILGEGSSASQNKYYSSIDTDSDTTLFSSSSDKPEGSANKTDDADESDIDLSDDNLDGDDDDASSDKPEGSANKTDDADESDIDLSDDNPDGDDDDDA
nr:hypothetical protein [Tanacetum cinerariifolium]